MSVLIEALDRILNWLEENEPLDYAQIESLQLGLAYEEIEEKVANVPFCLPREVYDLYGWANGAWKEEKHLARFFNGYPFLSLESALSKYYFFTGLFEETDISENEAVLSFWNERWFPIFYDIDPPMGYVVVLDENQKETTPVLYVSWEEADEEPNLIYEPYIIYPTLTNMMLAEAELYDSGFYLRQAELYKSNSYSQAYKIALHEESEYIRKKYQEQPMRVWRSPKN